MANENFQDFLETQPGSLNLLITAPDRVYQTSNIIAQDKNKDGLLSFLNENARYTSTSTETRPEDIPMMAGTNQQTGQSSGGSSTGGY